MNDKFKQISVAALEYRMAVLWFILFTINSLGTCYLAVTSACVWHLLDTQSKIGVGVAIIVNWTGTMMAYISNASKRVKQGGDLINPPDDATLTPKPTDQPKP